MKVVVRIQDDRREENWKINYSEYSMLTREGNDSMDYFHEWIFVDEEEVWRLIEMDEGRFLKV